MKPIPLVERTGGEELYVSLKPLVAELLKA
jgi:hypothetical protein